QVEEENISFNIRDADEIRAVLHRRGEPRTLPLGLLALRDVNGHAGETDGMPLLAFSLEKALTAGKNPADFAVRPHDAVVDVVLIGDLRIHGAVNGLADPERVLGMDPGEEDFTAVLLVRSHVKNLEPSLRTYLPFGLRIVIPGAGLSAFDGEARALVGFLDRGLRGLAVMNVKQNAQPPGDLTFGIFEGQSPAQVPAILAIARPAVAKLGFIERGAPNPFSFELEDIVRMERLHPSPAGGLLRGHAGEL